MAAGVLKPRWGQPFTGIVSFGVFFIIAWLTWFLFSDPRGPVGWFPYPFVLYLAMMILMGVFQHMLLGDWPFQNIPQPMRGVILTIVNLILVWFVIDIVFYRVIGIGFNFFSYYGLDALSKPGKLAQVAVVCFVLVGFYTYPVGTIFFGKWPIQPSSLKQPEGGLAEIGFGTFISVIVYAVFIVPFFGSIFQGPALSLPWWGTIGGTSHVHWFFGWWEWSIVILFMTPNVWRMKPWSLITLAQPWKGLISTLISLVAGYGIALFCLKVIPMWVPAETFQHLEEIKGLAEVQRFLWLHSAEIAGFTLIPFLAWHHYFDDMVPMADKDSWGAFFFRTIGVMVFAAGIYWVFYYGNFGFWGLGNSHMEHFSHRFPQGESLLWSFWWVIPLLWNEWFFHKWPFYVLED